MSVMPLNSLDYSKAANLLYNVLFDSRYECYVYGDLVNLKYNLNRDYNARKNIHKIFRMFYRLNILSFNKRYKTREILDLPIEIHNKGCADRPEFSEFVKLVYFLNCIKYQCSELNDRKVFKFLEFLTCELTLLLPWYISHNDSKSLFDKHGIWGSI